MGGSGSGGARPVAGGLWPAGGAVDRADKALSLPAFTLELPAPIEWALSVPGVWFGVPLYALLTLPLLQAALAADAGAALPALAGAVLLASLAQWFGVLRAAQALQDPAGEAAAAAVGSVYQPGGKRLSPLVFLLAPHAALALCRAAGGGERAVHTACFAQASWLLVQGFVALGKRTFQRERPVAAAVLRPRLAKVHRHLPALQAMLRHPSTVLSSFPSGDVAGACGWALAGAHSLGGRYGALWLGGLGGSALGRLFFHAHHLLDVSTGAAAAVLGVALAAAAAGSPFTLLAASGAAPAAPIVPGWGHARLGGCQLLFVIVFLASERLVSKEARH